jgi:erythromycin esterase
MPKPRICSRARGAFTLALILALASRGTAAADDDSDWKPPPLAPPPPGALSEAVDWARAHAVPLQTLEPGSGYADLQPLGAMIGDARIIGFGEGMHDTHEYLAFRNRLFEFLVEEMGVTAIGLETGATEALAADDYVLGRADASMGVYASVFSWASGEATQESQQLLDWMRSYNQRPTTRRPLRVYGLDLTGGRSGRFTDARLAPDAMLAYLERVDAKLAKTLRKTLDPALPKFNAAGYASLQRSARDALTGAFADAIGAFEREHLNWVAASSAFDYHRAYQQAVVSRQLDMGFRNSHGHNPQSQRDASMARNALWALEREGPQGKLLVFAYVGHIKKSVTPADSGSLGAYLHELVGSQYFVIGSLFNQGAVGTAGIDEWPMPLSDPSTLNAALRAGAGRDLFYVDTRRLPTEGPLADWVDRGEPLRHHYFEGRPRASFDALVFVDTIRPLHRLELRTERQRRPPGSRSR